MSDNQHPIADEQLWIEQARQSADGFRELYRAYFPRVYAYVAYRVGRVQDVEDIVAETFLKAVEHLEQFEYQGEGAFAAWLFRIAHNSVLDFYRRSTHRGPIVSLDELPDLSTTVALPEDVVMSKEQFAEVQQLICSLSPRRQEVITLKFFGGLRNQEIATILELDQRSVASHLCRGLEDLYQRYQQLLAQHDQGEVHERRK